MPDGPAKPPIDVPDDLFEEDLVSPDGAEIDPGLQLRLTQVFKSPNPVIEPEKVQCMSAIGDYTLIIPEGRENMIIVDKAGEICTDVEHITGKPVLIDWEAIVGPEKREIVRQLSTFSSDNQFLLTDLPEKIQKMAEDHIERYRSGIDIGSLPFELTQVGRRELEEWLELDGIDFTGNFKITAYNNGVFVVYDTVNEVFIIFKTRDKEQNIQGPTNWHRQVTLVSRTKYNNSLIWDIINKNRGLILLNNQYYIDVTDPNCVIIKSHGQDESIFTDSIGGVDDNICVDPQNSNVIYYCKKENPTCIRRLDTSDDPSAWHVEELTLPQNRFNWAGNLRFDPNGAFITFNNQSGELIFLERNTLEQIDTSEIPAGVELKFDEDGRIRRIDNDGHLVVEELNTEEVYKNFRAKKVSAAASSINVSSILNSDGATAESDVDDDREDYSYLDETRVSLEAQFGEYIEGIEDVNDFQSAEEKFAQLTQEYRRRNLTNEEVGYLTKNIRVLLDAQKAKVAIEKVTEILDGIRPRLKNILTFGDLAGIREELSDARLLQGYLDNEKRHEITEVSDEFEKITAELFTREAQKITTEIDETVSRVQAELEGFESLSQFNDWDEFVLPTIIQRLSLLAADCPAEATEVHSRLIDARKRIRELADEYRERFQTNYEDVRLRAAKRIDDLKETIESDIKAFTNRLKQKRFTNRNEAENYIDSSPALRALQEEINSIKSLNPQVSDELDSLLHSELSVVIAEVERGMQVHVSETGQQMVKFGEILFPKWEGELPEPVEPSVEPTLIPDRRTFGDNLMCDIGIRVITASGREYIRRLFEGLDDEDEWRYGGKMVDGELVPASYMSVNEYGRFRAVYDDWHTEHSRIQKKFIKKRQALEVQLRKRPDETSWRHKGWQKKYNKLFKDLLDFTKNNYLLLIRRIDDVRGESEVKDPDFVTSGSVPNWKPHWVMDPDTEKHLEKMAEEFQMQSDLQEGCLLLKGHAGTGKDVLIKMFCEKTNRPYFAIDCTKWTTEFELSEDIILESKDGASQTIKVPSVVLNAITTPGALMYFNEFNAMPEQAQIFLHALFDEKRSLTLKTSSGQTIKAHKSVLFAASMNPNYPGTFPPQFATKRRFIPYEIGYPEIFTEETKEDDNPAYSASEALRIARGVESLRRHTWDANMDKNQFVKMWNYVVNGDHSNVAVVSDEEKFDIEVILALTQFGKIIRDNFITKISGGAESTEALPIDQPFTLSEGRRCAHKLSKIPTAEKAMKQPEQVAKKLIERVFLYHIDNAIYREEIRKTMYTNWTMQKRVASA